jgi:HK97 family phage major capsid protein
MTILTPEELRAWKIVTAERALGLGTAGGSFAVPFQLDGSLVPTSDSSINPIRALARQVSITSNEFRQATSGAMTATYAAEFAVATDTGPTLAQPALIPKRVHAFTPASLEVTEDWQQLLAELGTLIQEAKDDLESVQFTSGVGTTVFPQGILTGGTASSRAFDLAGLYLTELELPARWRKHAVWMGNKLRFQDIRKFVVPESAAPVWEHTPGGPSEIFEYPAYENSSMTTATSSGSKVLAFGDPNAYQIVDRIGLDIEITTHIPDSTTFFPKGQKGIYAFWRNYAALLSAASWRIFTIP